MALQRAIPRYEAVLQSLSDRFINVGAWLAEAHSNETDFVEAAGQLHTFLVGATTNFSAQEAYASERLAHYHVLKSAVALLEARARAIRARLNSVASAQAAVEENIELLNRTALQLGARTRELDEELDRLKDGVLQRYAVYLVPGDVIPMERTNEGSGSDSTRFMPIENGQQRQAYFAVPAFNFVEPPEPPAKQWAVPALSGGVEDLVGTLEAEATDLRTAFDGRNAAYAKLVPVRAAIRSLEERGFNIKFEIQNLPVEINNAEVTLNETRRRAARQEISMEMQLDDFAVMAAHNWIWQNMKREAVAVLKTEVKRLAMAAGTGRESFELSDLEVGRFYAQSKYNVFGLPDAATKTSALITVQKQTLALLAHGQEYMQQAAELGAHGTPGQMQEFADGMFQGMDRDAEELVRVSLAAAQIREPFNTIYRKLFLKAGTP